MSHAVGGVGYDNFHGPVSYFPLPVRRSASIKVRQNIVDPRQVTLALRGQPLQHLWIKAHAHRRGERGTPSAAAR
jgi:hypothetical protein